MIGVSRETQLLKQANEIIDRFVGSFARERRQEARFQILEAMASRFGGFDLLDYQSTFRIASIANVDVVMEAARDVVECLEETGIPASLALSALAREALDKTAQRRSGAYHTDFRLAQHLADLIAPKVRAGIKVVDPACGAGILLAALTIKACGADRNLTNAWLAKSVYAADLAENALRGTLIALACHTDDVNVLSQMRNRWRVQDSLLAGCEAWRSEAKGFDIVVANPPWEKIKLTRHEFLQSEGVDRHYGSAYSHYDRTKYSRLKAIAEDYSDQLLAKYSALRVGEPDLYVAFTELLIELVNPGGACGLLLPAGLIRSQSTELARRMILDRSSEVTFEVIENRARFFEIDTRFKFLTVVSRKAKRGERAQAIKLGHAHGTPLGVQATSPVAIGRSALARLRPDFSIPEVKSSAEWHLFCDMAQRGIDWADPQSPWHPQFMREVDMTRDRKLFQVAKSRNALPVVEGRMVHQHRFGVKSYNAGSGRSAVWKVSPPGASVIQPQFWISPSQLGERVFQRSQTSRVGFCDITGQTNERSCLAAMIPAGTVCGNKVPTILFPNDPRECRLWLSLALANSFAFDWMIRRVITTTINYFHLLSLSLPPIDPDSLPGRQLVQIAQRLSALDHGGSNWTAHWQMAELRAKADALVLNSYGLGVSELDVMMKDFPLVDRGQPPIPGEERSTVTRDLIASHLHKAHAAAKTRARVEAAKAVGAVAYMPAQMSPAYRTLDLVEAEHG